MLARFLFLAAVRPLADRLAARAAAKAHRDGRRLAEQLWMLAGNSLSLALGARALAHNGGCALGASAACLAGWPGHAVEPAVEQWYAFEAAWYLQLLAKTALGLGPPDGPAMLAHHAVSLALIAASRALNFVRIGTRLLALFAASNPLLHAAKAASQLEARARVPLFAAFAAAFFATRVLAAPLAVLAPVLRAGGAEVLPHAVADFKAYHAAFCAALVALYALQLVWGAAIVRVLAKAARGGADAAAELSARVDPSGRFADAARAPGAPRAKAA
jgi:hypothetical protein